MTDNRVPFNELVEVVEQNFQVTTSEAYALASKATQDDSWKEPMGIAKYEDWRE